MKSVQLFECSAGQLKCLPFGRTQDQLMRAGATPSDSNGHVTSARRHVSGWRKYHRPRSRALRAIDMTKFDSRIARCRCCEDVVRELEPGRRRVGH